MQRPSYQSEVALGHGAAQVQCWCRDASKTASNTQCHGDANKARAEEVRAPLVTVDGALEACTHSPLLSGSWK